MLFESFDLISGELHLSLVLSTRAHAKVKKLDPTAALAIPGVVAFYSYKDVNPEHFKPVDISLSGDRIFAQEEVRFITVFESRDV